MKLLWNEVKRIEAYLKGQIKSPDQLWLQKKPDFKEAISWQKRTYQIIQLAGRRSLKKELHKVAEIYFSER